MSEEPEPNVGKGNPPMNTRFKPGQTGNAKGRPRGKRRTLPYETVLGQMLTVTENGVARQLPADAAFILQLANWGMADDPVAARAVLEAMEDSRASAGRRRRPLEIIQTVYPEPGDVGMAMRSLRMATLLDGFRPTARMAIEPWLVQAALERLGDRRLSEAEQEIVVASAKTPGKVRWPECWTANGCAWPALSTSRS